METFKISAIKFQSIGIIISNIASVMFNAVVVVIIIIHGTIIIVYIVFIIIYFFVFDLKHSHGNKHAETSFGTGNLSLYALLYTERCYYF